MVSGSSSNLDLLTAEIEIIWEPGGRGTETPPSVVIGDAGGQVVVRTRTDLPKTTADAVVEVAAAERLPQAARRIQEALHPAIGDSEVTVGPSYDCSAPAEQPAPALGRLLRSDAGDPDVLSTLRTPPTWEAEDWPQLLAGRLGPWGMVCKDQQVLSLCHCARMATDGVEAGVWTADDARGRGLAAVATAAWADACRPLPGHVFYSTDAYNLSSQRVAARLRLPPIGQLWKFRRHGEGNGPPDARLSPPILLDGRR